MSDFIAKEKLELFLSTRIENTGEGWTEVSKSDWEDLHDLIQTIIAEKFDTDIDGDPPINYRLVNRNTHRFMHFDILPYAHKLNREELLQALRYLTGAQSSIAGEIDCFMHYLKNDLDGNNHNNKNNNP